MTQASLDQSLSQKKPDAFRNHTACINTLSTSNWHTKQACNDPSRSENDGLGSPMLLRRHFRTLVISHYSMLWPISTQDLQDLPLKIFHRLNSKAPSVWTESSFDTRCSCRRSRQ